MFELGLKAKHKRRFRVMTTDSNHNQAISPNLLPELEITGINQARACDITYLRLRNGNFLYLAVVLDLHSRKVIGWSFSESLHRDIVCNALKMALKRRGKNPGLLFHSDQGSQYASKEFRDILKENKIIQSMSRKGNCYDNSFVESYFHSLKVEVGDVFIDKIDAQSKNIFYIEAYYNRKRRHSSLGYLSPVKFERNQATLCLS